MYFSSGLFLLPSLYFLKDVLIHFLLHLLASLSLTLALPLSLPPSLPYSLHLSPLPSSLPTDPVLDSLITWNKSEYCESNIEEMNAYDSDYEQDNDAELLRTQQGLRHIGPKGEFDRTSARLSLPIPFSLNALLLPMRVYVSFTRVGRVIERIVEQGGDLQPFSLVFRDSLFEGDSHASLLSTLRRCGRIVTLSFANYKSVDIERDSRMGWLVGNLPPSIRFVRYGIPHTVLPLCLSSLYQSSQFLFLFLSLHPSFYPLYSFLSLSTSFLSPPPSPSPSLSVHKCDSVETLFPYFSHRYKSP